MYYLLIFLKYKEGSQKLKVYLLNFIHNRLLIHWPFFKRLRHTAFCDFILELIKCFLIVHLVECEHCTETLLLVDLKPNVLFF